MKTNIDNWKLYRFGDIIDEIYKAVAHTKDDVEECDSRMSYAIPFVSRTEPNNSVDFFVKSHNLVGMEKGNAIVIGDTTATISYQAKNFIAGDHIVVIRADWLDKMTGLFIVTLLKQERFRYSYGRAFTVEQIENTMIRMPYDLQGEPDWEYIRKYMGGLHNKPLITSRQSLKKLLQVTEWKEYKLESIFIIKKGKRLISDEQTAGETPYIGAIDSNNGVANYIGQRPIHDGNTISLSYNGSVGEAFYQSQAYWATDDVNALYFRKSNHYNFNKYIALFICTVLGKEKYRFSYGRKWTLDNMNKSIIKLPSCADGTPNWKWMEDYIKTLPMAEHLI